MTIKRILIIDDEADVREIAKLSLEITRQWDVTTAASGEEGVRLASTQHPDAILLDVVMPQTDGL
ncbi:MAG: response regulator, partial [Nodosilinea sp.]